MVNGCIYCSSHSHVASESRTTSNAAGPSSINKSNLSAQRAISRQSSSISSKSRSAKSDVTLASKTCALRLSTYQQRTVKASLTVLVSLFYYCSF